MSTKRLEGCTILVLEDEHLVAESIADGLAASGAVVAGPFSAANDALAWLSNGHSINAAVLDVRLRGHTCFKVAEALASNDVPIVFATAIEPSEIPAQFSAAPVVPKPSGIKELLNALAEQLPNGCAENGTSACTNLSV